MASKKKKAEPIFEEAIEKLEETIEILNEGGLPLHELLEHYEEGASLIKLCNKQLSHTAQRIEIIDKELAEQRLQYDRGSYSTKESKKSKVDSNDDPEQLI